MPKNYGKRLKRIYMSEKEKEELEEGVVDEDFAVSMFK